MRLLENAIDSLAEGLLKYRQAHDGEHRAYKFAVLHVAHFLELLLKHAVAMQHPLLVLENPATTKPKSDKTIGLWDAISILRNSGIELEEDLIADLKWLKQLRNQIEHYEFELDVRQIREVLGRVIRAAQELATSARIADLTSNLPAPTRTVLEELVDEYAAKLANAQADARDDGGEICDCALCGEPRVANSSEDSVRCHFCAGSEDVRRCCICDEPTRESQLSVWNDEHDDYICEFCEERLLGDD